MSSGYQLDHYLMPGEKILKDFKGCNIHITVEQKFNPIYAQWTFPFFWTSPFPNFWVSKVCFHFFILFPIEIPVIKQCRP